MSMDDLPDEFKKQVQDAYNHYVAAYVSTKPGQNNAGTGAVPRRNSTFPYFAPNCTHQSSTGSRY